MIVDSCEKAFSLGFLSYIGEVHTSYSKNCYEFVNVDEEEDEEILKVLKDYVDIITEDGTTSMTLNNIGLLDEMKLVIKEFKKFENDYKRAFIRGLYEYNNLHDSSSNDIYMRKNEMIKNNYQDFMEFLEVPYIVDDENRILIKYGCSSTDFLGFIYNDISNNLSFTYNNYNLTIPNFNVVRVDENAVFPTKKNWSDVGFDLTIIKKVEDYNSRTALYDTGIKIDIDYGYYAEIVPRSSISKSGYMMANGIGIIDNSYRGNLMVALTKICDDAKELELPFRCCQLIIKEQVNVNFRSVEGYSKTKRGDGGFGSTG